MQQMTGKSRTSKNSPRPLFLGVDGGGTKTLAVVSDADGKTLGEGKTGASNPLRVGIETAIDNIFQATVIACDKARKSTAEIVSGVFGLAGVRREDIRARMRELLRKRLHLKFSKVVTDAEIALYGAVNGGAGLVIIAGTGSICCGRNENGDFAMAGGWGPLAGDEGGGAGIARRALQSIARASDGRGKLTTLSNYALDYFRVSLPEDISTAIYAPTMTNDKIAGFAKFVIQAAQEGDEVAIELTNEAGRELGIAANAVIHKLNLAGNKFPVAYVGGVFHAKQLIFQPLLAEIHQSAPEAYISPPQLPPAVAAAKMAVKLMAEN